MDSSKLKSWKEKILDFSKKNQLYNLSRSYCKRINVGIFKNDENYFEKVFNDIINNEKNTIFDIVGYKKNNKNQEKDDSKIIEEILDNSEIKSSNEIVLLPIDNKIDSLETKIRKIQKADESFFKEHGFHILFIYFGTLEWFEHEEDPETEKIISPLFLVPVEICTKNNVFSISSNKIKEFIFNKTLWTKLKNDFKYQLKDYSYDDNFLINDALLEIEKALYKQKQWKISRSIGIGTFDFSKISIYNDMDVNEEEILKNKNVLKILGQNINQNLSSNNEEIKLDQKEEVELHNIFDADSSQLKAIKCAKKGQSFTLQGPPGTGKTQTIINIIAEFLYDGKSVLFVSEKMAALDVVYNKLKQQDLSHFCLNLHKINSSTKKEFYQQIFDCYEKFHRNEYTDQTQSIEKIKTELSKEIGLLNKYDIFLNSKVSEQKIASIDETPYQIKENEINYLNKIKNTINNYDIDQFKINNIDKISLDDLKERCGSLDTISEFLKRMKLSDKNKFSYKWYGISYKDDYQDHNTKQLIERNLKLLNELLSQIRMLPNCIYSILSKNDIDYMFNQFNEILNLVFKIDEEEGIKVFDYISDNKIKNSQDLCELTLKYIEENEKLKKNISFDESIFKDEKIKKQILNDKFGWLKKWKLKKSSNIKSNDLLKKNINSFKEWIATDEKITKNCKSILEIFSINKNLNNNHQFIKLISLFSIDKDLSNSLIKANYSSLQDINIFLKKYKYDTQKDELDNFFDINEFNFSKESIEVNLDKFKVMNNQQDSPSLEDYMKFKRELNKIKEDGWYDFIDWMGGPYTINENSSNMYKYLFYSQMVRKLYKEKIFDDSIYKFNSISDLNDHYIKYCKEFKKHDKEKIEKTHFEIISKITSKWLSTSTSGTPCDNVRLECKKTRNQTNIRKFLEDSGNMEYVKKITPCFLMSPLSASTFLQPTSELFDLLICDEASQIFPQDAICSIYRAKQVIIVGDSKQMPPNTAFKSFSTDDENDDDSINPGDFESILDIWSSKTNNQKLNWHYRSRHQSLIAFSNKNFYDNELITFPNASYTNNNDYEPITSKYIENGRFIDNFNKGEAAEIIKLINEHILNHKDKSLGIITFNLKQADYINDLFEKEKKKNSKIVEFCSTWEEKNEPFFIKPLENVQGDERDTIFISVCYGKDKDGQLHHWFGPINSKGGERRLNVAFTRAKNNMVVVSSMKPQEINSGNHKYKGAKILKDFLEYINLDEKGREIYISSSPTPNKFDSPFEEEVFNFIEGFLDNNKYEIISQFKSFGFFIDMVIKDKKTGNYVLAIECDGKTYHSRLNARDRDRLRQEMLEDKGWKFYRILSTRWWKKDINCEKEIIKNEILELLSDKNNQINNDNSIEKNINVIKEKPETKLSEKFSKYP